eukprot:TRINITY_DN28982_c0_g1_i1.p1 TRINITY_DN28982_c0_g1~~TRINITY_DN28982_c0_g1_i1.p1  ORF type:complete len:308 (-),score=71.12 TRINITY_DN28982_c0_g1_i1:258-1181(-)
MGSNVARPVKSAAVKAPESPDSSFEGKRRPVYDGPVVDDYDPCKPEYIIPATESDIERGMRELRERQAKALESAVARWTADGRSARPGVLEHYRQQVQELRRLAEGGEKALSVPPPPEPIVKREKPKCPVCLEAASPSVVVVTLACGHPLCCGCACKCAASGLNSCPVCRHPHLLDPKLLAERSEQWRQKYLGWRAGKPKGAEGETSSICDPKAAEALEGADLGAIAAPLFEWLGSAKFSEFIARKEAHPAVTSVLAGDLVVAKRTLSGGSVGKRKGKTSSGGVSSVVGAKTSQRSLPRGCWAALCR